MAAACGRSSAPDVRDTSAAGRASADRAGHRLVCRPLSGDGARLRALQRDVRRPLLRGTHGARRGAVRLRQRWRPRRVPSPGADARHRQEAGAGAVSSERPAAVEGTPVPERPAGQRGRHALVALHRRDGGKRAERERVRDGGGHGRLRQRRLCRSLRHRARPQPVVPQQLQRHLCRRVEGEPDGRYRLEHVGGVCRLRS